MPELNLKQLKPANVKRALKFDLSDVRQRFQKDFDKSNKEAKKLERELKRYLIVAAELRGKVAVGMRGPVDDFWHTFIIFTHEYTKFCNDLCGHYIHHAPNRLVEDVTNVGKGKKTYGVFLKAYTTIFGEKPPSDIWPTAQSSIATSCENCYNCMGSCDCEPDVPCDNREPDQEGTDPDQDSDSDTDDDRDTDSDVDADVDTETVVR